MEFVNQDVFPFNSLSSWADKS